MDLVSVNYGNSFFGIDNLIDDGIGMTFKDFGGIKTIRYIIHSLDPNVCEKVISC